MQMLPFVVMTRVRTFVQDVSMFPEVFLRDGPKQVARLLNAVVSLVASGNTQMVTVWS